MKKKLFSGLLVFAFTFAGIGSVLADGMVIHRPDPYSGDWDYADESDQKAFINYQKGLEKMIVGVKIDDLQNQNAVWVFPVPADPTKVVIDVVDELPEMGGVEVGSKAKVSLSKAKDILFASQIYPIFFRERGYDDYPTMDGGMMLSATKGYAPEANMAEQDVVVYEHLDKEGLSSEIITAKTANGIYDYFAGKGLKIEKGMIPALDAYIGKEYSFVATWINTGAAETEVWANKRDRQYIKDNLAAYLGLPSVQIKLYDMKMSYPEIDVEAVTGAGGFQVNADNVVPYLQSDKGSAALDELVASIQTDASLDNTVISPNAVPVDDWNGGGAVKGMSYSPSSYVSPGYPSDYWSEYYYPEQNSVKGISVYFPTDSIYFPLLPTSVYESKTVPAMIKVVGYVDPRIYEGIDNFTKVSYYTDAYYSYTDADGSGSQNTFFDNVESGYYTKIEIAAPSKFLTEDLWIQDSAPLKVLWKEAVASLPYVVAGIVLILCSLAAVFAAGWPLLKDLRKNPVKLALLGLANCLSLIGLTVAVLRVGSNEPAKKDDAALLDKLKERGYFKKRRLARIYFTAALLIFLTMTFGMEAIGYFINYTFGYYYDFPYQLLTMIGLAFVYSPLILAFLGWRAAQVVPEDKALFEEMKAKGYSSWQMASKSNNRFLFIVFFSLIFLVLAWLAIWLLTKTV